MIVMMAGLPGSGKSTLASALAEQLDGIVLDKDKVRSALFPAKDVEYSTTQDDFCVEVMLKTAEFILRKNASRIVFIDGRPFSRAHQVDRVVDFAERMGQAWMILECVCSEESARARLAGAGARHHPAANRNADLYASVKAGAEPIVRAKTVLDTEKPLQDCVDLALREMRPYV